MQVAAHVKEKVWSLQQEEARLTQRLQELQAVSREGQARLLAAKTACERADAKQRVAGGEASRVTDPVLLAEYKVKS